MIFGNLFRSHLLSDVKVSFADIVGMVATTSNASALVVIESCVLYYISLMTATSFYMTKSLKLPYTATSIAVDKLSKIYVSSSNAIYQYSSTCVGPTSSNPIIHCKLLLRLVALLYLIHAIDI